jgi:2-phospho-L-lactate guanylyltransferase
MTLHIVVPVKHLAESKSRLAPVLDTDQRRALMRTWLRHVLDVVRQAQDRLPVRGAVISADQEVLALAESYGLTALREQTGHLPVEAAPEASLNAALEQATAWAKSQAASGILVLPADLPLLALADVEALWRASQQLYSPRATVIAPDGREEGTNALLVRPPGALTYQFGPHSFRRHCRQARQLGLAWHVFRSPRLGLDVDLPADLECYLAVENADMERGRMETRRRRTDGQLAAFLNQPGLLMRLGTLGQDGYPQVTPVWYLYEDGVFYITTASDRVKTANMLARPKVGFAVDSDVRPYRGVSVWGQARLVAEGEAARALTRRIAARYVPAERLADMVASLMQAPRVIFAIEAVKMVGNLPELEESGESEGD